MMKTIHLAAAALMPAAALAQAPLSATDIAAFALDVCISETADVGVNVETGDFMIRGRQGDTASYTHSAGPELALTVRPGFFGCELTVEGADPAYLDALLAELRPAMQERFGIAPQTVSNGAFWETTISEETTLTTEVSRGDDAVVTLTSTTNAAPQPPAQ